MPPSRFRVIPGAFSFDKFKLAIDRLSTAKELLDHDDKLSLEDREKLWGLLQYVMSDPKSDMVPAKRKLFEIGLGKALPATREFFLDFMAKYLAEMTKS